MAWGGNTAKPKHHFFLHLPLAIFMFGPMKVWWCMRFEAKHQYFKKLVKVIILSYLTLYDLI